MKPQKSKRWILFWKIPRGTLKPDLMDSFAYNYRDLVHFYRWQAVDMRKTFAQPSQWGIARVEIMLTPTTVID